MLGTAVLYAYIKSPAPRSRADIPRLQGQPVNHGQAGDSNSRLAAGTASVPFRRRIPPLSPVLLEKEEKMTCILPRTNRARDTSNSHNQPLARLHSKKRTNHQPPASCSCLDREIRREESPAQSQPGRQPTRPHPPAPAHPNGQSQIGRVCAMAHTERDTPPQKRYNERRREKRKTRALHQPSC